MPYIVRMPKLGVEMQTGTLLEWHVGVGDDVAEEDVLAEIESEKTVAEVAAREGGALRHVFLEEGSEVEPGTAMGIVAPPNASVDELLSEVNANGADVSDGNSGNDISNTEMADAKPTAATDDSEGQNGRIAETSVESSDITMTPKARNAVRQSDAALDVIEATGPRGAVTEADVERAVNAPPESNGGPTASGVGQSSSLAGEPLATPRARKRAAELDVELTGISGSGPQGSVRAADVKEMSTNHTNRGSEQATTTESAGIDARTLVEERPLSGMRSTIARRIGESYRNAPHVTVNREIDIETALTVVDEADPAVSVTDILLRSVSRTLNAHPDFNATLDDDVHRLYEEHNIGVAVEIDQGLVTPVLNEVNESSVVEIAHRRRALVNRVQGGRYNADDLSGGTFTISNLGMFGVDSFTPIINPPEVAILGIDRIREVPKRTDTGIEFRRMMGFSLSFDHRVVDGADAARFLDTLSKMFSNADEHLEP